MGRAQIGELEELILLLVAALDGSAYGVNVRKELMEKANRKLNISAVHSTLDRLEKKGMVESSIGGSSSERGGRRKRLFRITAYGIKVLKDAKEIREGLYHKVQQLSPGTI